MFAKKKQVERKKKKDSSSSGSSSIEKKRIILVQAIQNSCVINFDRCPFCYQNDSNILYVMLYYVYVTLLMKLNPMPPPYFVYCEMMILNE